MFTLAALLLGAFVWLLTAAHARYQQLSQSQRLMFCLGAIGAIMVGLAGVAVLVRNNTRNPPEWDMLIFWINGVVASKGLNFYDSALTTQLAAPFHPGAEFVQIALGTPFLYPPPSIAWFIPLGWFDIHTATAVWFALNLGCLAASVIILSRTILEGLSTGNVLFVSALVLMMWGTYANIKTAQTVFLLLLFVTMAFRNRDNFRGGIYLALAILAKPFVAIVIVYSVIRRKWPALIATAATLLLACLATLLIFGRGVFAGYAAIRFSALPMSMYTEIQNQSLLAWVLRITHSPARFPAGYLIFVALLGAALLWRLSTVPAPDEAAGFALALTFGLLVYPASLRSYTVVLILPLLVLYSVGLRWSVALAFGLMVLAGGDYVILATLCTGIALAFHMRALPGVVEDPVRVEMRKLNYS